MGVSPPAVRETSEPQFPRMYPSKAQDSPLKKDSEWLPALLWLHVLKYSSIAPHSMPEEKKHSGERRMGEIGGN